MPPSVLMSTCATCNQPMYRTTGHKEMAILRSKPGTIYWRRRTPLNDDGWDVAGPPSGFFIAVPAEDTLAAGSASAASSVHPPSPPLPPSPSQHDDDENGDDDDDDDDDDAPPPPMPPWCQRLQDSIAASLPVPAWAPCLLNSFTMNNWHVTSSPPGPSLSPLSASPLPSQGSSSGWPPALLAVLPSEPDPCSPLPWQPWPPSDPSSVASPGGPIPHLSAPPGVSSPPVPPPAQPPNLPASPVSKKRKNGSHPAACHREGSLCQTSSERQCRSRTPPKKRLPRRRRWKRGVLFQPAPTLPFFPTWAASLASAPPPERIVDQVSTLASIESYRSEHTAEPVPWLGPLELDEHFPIPPMPSPPSPLIGSGSASPHVADPGVQSRSPPETVIHEHSPHVTNASVSPRSLSATVSYHQPAHVEDTPTERLTVPDRLSRATNSPCSTVAASFPTVMQALLGEELPTQLYVEDSPVRGTEPDWSGLMDGSLLDWAISSPNLPYGPMQGAGPATHAHREPSSSGSVMSVRDTSQPSLHRNIADGLIHPLSAVDLFPSIPMSSASSPASPIRDAQTPTVYSPGSPRRALPISSPVVIHIRDDDDGRDAAGPLLPVQDTDAPDGQTRLA